MTPEEYVKMSMVIEETKKTLKNLVKEIEEIPDGDVDRWLIIEEIKKIIKEIEK